MTEFKNQLQARLNAYRAKYETVKAEADRLAMEAQNLCERIKATETLLADETPELELRPTGIEPSISSRRSGKKLTPTKAARVLMREHPEIEIWTPDVFREHIQNLDRAGQIRHHYRTLANIGHTIISAIAKTGDLVKVEESANPVQYQRPSKKFGKSLI